MENILREFLSGGEYNHDLIDYYVDGKYVKNIYYSCESDSSDDDDITDFYINEIIKMIKNGHTITLKGFRAMQGGRPTEILTLDKLHHDLEDIFDAYKYDNELKAWVLRTRSLTAS